MNNILLIAVGVAGLGLLLVLFKMLKKGGKLLSKLPTNFMLFFLVFAVLGLSGFLLQDRITEHPVLLGVLLLLAGLIGGIIMTYRLYEDWEWGISAGFAKKLLYLFGITLISMVGFSLTFLLCEHWGFPKDNLKQDLVWWLAGTIFIILLPLIIRHLHLLWNEIPKFAQLIPVFNLPIGTSAPFIEAGGASVGFLLIIPLNYRSKDIVESRVSIPLNKTVSEAFHYKLHEHNVIKKFAKKIALAEENKRAKVYGWSFYRTRSTWWGWWIRKDYLDPNSNVGITIANGEKIYVERVKVWE